MSNNIKHISEFGEMIKELLAARRSHSKKALVLNQLAFPHTIQKPTS